jgi:hypothetical protein
MDLLNTDLLNTVTFVIGIFLVLGLAAWASVTSLSDTVAWNRRATQRVSTRNAQLAEVSSRR